MTGNEKSTCLALPLLGQLVHQGSAGDCLAGARGSLDEAEGGLQHCLHSIHLCRERGQQSCTEKSEDLLFSSLRGLQ